MHDFAIGNYRDIYKRLREVFEITRGKCVVDSAFIRVLYSFLVKSGHKYPRSFDYLEAIQMDREENFAIESTGCGMRAIQG